MLQINEESIIECLGEFLYEYESKRTIRGNPLPDAKKMEMDIWYETVARQLFEASVANQSTEEHYE